jgi:hypothetical protein
MMQKIKLVFQRKHKESFSSIHHMMGGGECLYNQHKTAPCTMHISRKTVENTKLNFQWWGLDGVMDWIDICCPCALFCALPDCEHDQGLFQAAGETARMCNLAVVNHQMGILHSTLGYPSLMLEGPNIAKQESWSTKSNY